MIPILIALIAYLLTTAATLWMIHRKLQSIRSDVREVARSVIEHAIAEGKDRAANAVVELSESLLKPAEATGKSVRQIRSVVSRFTRRN